MRIPRNAMLLPVYVPTALLAFGQGLLIPTLPVYAESFGVSYFQVSLAVGAAAIGTLVADVPAGMLLGRLGRKRAMLIGTSMVAISTLLIGLAQAYPELVLYRFVAGVGTALWGISRHAYITDVVPVAERDGQMERDYWYTSGRGLPDLITPEEVGRIAAERTVKRGDSDKDGVLSMSEASRLDVDPSAADTNGDSRITVEEYAWWSQTNAESKR